jgi:hypothetical protein
LTVSEYSTSVRFGTTATFFVGVPLGVTRPDTIRYDCRGARGIIQVGFGTK